MKEYEDMQLKVGDKVAIEIKKADDSIEAQKRPEQSMESRNSILNDPSILA